MSLFITFEGGEGSGKSTQAKALWRKLSKLGITAELIHEPGSTPIGNEIRRSLKRNRQDNISSETELLLFAACRNQLVTEVIRPSLNEGKVIICDRFADSTTAYQGHGRRIDLALVKAINDLAVQSIKPDLTILLDIPPEKGLSRKQIDERDRFEEENLSFHKRVRSGYAKMASQEPERWLVIDATLPKTKIAEIIWDRVQPLLSQKKKTVKHG